MSRSLSLAERLVPSIARLDLPCFVYDPEILAENIAAIRRRFSGYSYPVKCNAHPALVRAALAAGAGLDLCSEGDLEIANEAGGLTRRSSYTGVGLSPEILRRLAASECRVNLDSWMEVEWWIRAAPGRECGLRLQNASGDPYGSKFGLTIDEVSRSHAMLSRSGGRLSGLHVHSSHRGRSPREAAAFWSMALRSVDGAIVQDLEYVNLGGGWPHAYEGETSWTVDELADAVESDVMPALHRDGFRGRILVEPGEFAVSSAGVWLARVATVKERNGSIVILDTPTPIPCADIAYPATLLRRISGGDYEPMSTSGGVRCTIHGATNSGRDVIRHNVVLSRPEPGDVVMIGDVGAYVQSLIGRFNEHWPPAAHIISPRP